MYQCQKSAIVVWDSSKRYVYTRRHIGKFLEIPDLLVRFKNNYYVVPG